MDSAIIKIQISGKNTKLFLIYKICHLITFFIHNLDHPDPPFSLSIEDIGQDSLILNWNAPTWDGGSNITNYLIEKREIPMSSWIRVGNTR